MLPCRKSTTSAFGARFIKLAESQARSLKGKSATKRIILEGCLVEGKKSGNNLSATVIDPQHSVYMPIHENLDSNSGTKNAAYAVNIDNRLALDPLSATELSLFEEGYNVKAKESFVGARPNGIKASSRAQHTKAGSRAVYYSDVIIDKSDSYFLRILEVRAGASNNLTTTISSSVISQIADGYSIGFSLSGKAFSGFVIEGDGSALIAVVNVTKTIVSDPLITREALLILVIDRGQSGTSISGALISETSLPAYLQPGTISYPFGSGYISRPAKTKFKPLDIERQQDGIVFVAFKYELEVEDSDNGRIGVESHGVAAWGFGNTFVSIHSTEVDADAGHAFIARFGADAATVKYGDTVNLVNGKAMRSVRVLARGNLFVGVSPFSLELIDGAPVEQSDFATPYYGQPELPMGRNENNFIIPLGGISAKVSPTTTAIVRGSPITSQHQDRSTSLGLAFTDGDRTVYEEVTGPLTSSRHLFLHVSCPQMEVRRGDQLLSPSTIIISGVIEGQTVIGIRKAPIWDEDKDPLAVDGDKWRFTFSNIGNNRAAYYIGNILTLRSNGALFYDQTND